MQLGIGAGTERRGRKHLRASAACLGSSPMGHSAVWRSSGICCLRSEDHEELDRVTLDPEVVGGRPCILGPPRDPSLGFSRQGTLKRRSCRPIPTWSPRTSGRRWRTRLGEGSDGEQRVKLLADMNRSPLWIDFSSATPFRRGLLVRCCNPRAPDATILEGARTEPGRAHP